MKERCHAAILQQVRVICGVGVCTGEKRGWANEGALTCGQAAHSAGHTMSCFGMFYVIIKHRLICHEGHPTI